VSPLERDAVIEAHMGLAIAIASRERLPAYMERADAVGAALLALVVAADRWRPEGGASFRTYVGEYVRNAVRIERRRARRWMTGDYIAQHGVDPWGRVPRHPEFRLAAMTRKSADARRRRALDAFREAREAHPEATMPELAAVLGWTVKVTYKWNAEHRKEGARRERHRPRTALKSSL
jgi:hypothetical protein